MLGVEKNNDEAKKQIFSSNMHDVAGEILKADALLEYWNAEIQENKSRS